MPLRKGSPTWPGGDPRAVTDRCRQRPGPRRSCTSDARRSAQAPGTCAADCTCRSSACPEGPTSGEVVEQFWVRVVGQSPCSDGETAVAGRLPDAAALPLIRVCRIRPCRRPHWASKTATPSVPLRRCRCCPRARYPIRVGIWSAACTGHSVLGSGGPALALCVFADGFGSVRRHIRRDCALGHPADGAERTTPGAGRGFRGFARRLFERPSSTAGDPPR